MSFLGYLKKQQQTTTTKNNNMNFTSELQHILPHKTHIKQDNNNNKH